MRRLIALAIVLLAGCHRAPAPPETTAAAAPAAPVNPATADVYMCPMDKDIRSYHPGNCPRCGMKLVTSIPDPVEYHLDVDVAPTPAPGQPVNLTFTVFDPWKNNPVSKFAVIHEKLFHAFVVSQDLEFFRHDHPVWRDGTFVDQVVFPKPGMYRVLADFYPEAATPQLLTHTVFVPGRETPAPAAIDRDYSPKHAENMNVAIASNPERAIAGMETRLRFTLAPAEGLERYLGVWAHMLAVSDDLIDMMHTHPSIADGSHELEFTVVFPRPRIYRVWVQFQRQGVVNTAHFDIDVHGPPEGGPHEPVS